MNVLMLSGHNVNGYTLAKFRIDRSCLLYTDAEIAAGMGMTRGNYCRYVNDKLPITQTFLRRFYAAFSDELNVARYNADRRGHLVDQIRQINLELRSLLDSLNKFMFEFDKLAESQ